MLRATKRTLTRSRIGGIISTIGTKKFTSIVSKLEISGLEKRGGDKAANRLPDSRHSIRVRSALTTHTP